MLVKPSTIAFDHGSFRDRSARVFESDGKIFRSLDLEATANWRKLSQTAFFKKHLHQKNIVHTKDVENPPSLSKQWTATLEHEKVPFISYAYEWSHSMLQKAALLHLELLEDALQENFILKDSSNFNIQFIGTHPIFIDIPSFAPYEKAEPWQGYRQFCEMFLFPLFLRAYHGVDFRPFLRGTIEGISLEKMYQLSSVRDLFRPGIFKHVWLQHWFEEHTRGPHSDAQSDLKRAGFQKEFILINIRHLRSLIKKLQARVKKSTWLEYSDNNSYQSHEIEEKKKAVEQFLIQKPQGIVWDLGCNSGMFSEIASKHSPFVLAIDSDPGVIEQFATRLPQTTNILPLVMDLADPSPALGFSNRERKTLSERGTPSSILALALIHHIVIGANVPLDYFIDWLAAQGGDLLLEFVTKEDEMTISLLAQRKNNYSDYNESYLEESLSRWYDIDKKQSVKGGKRVLYFCKHRNKQ